ncbi:hypothetical protein GCM10009630_55640 [Kribbella jejuensis]|uniref:flp pilus-assembly TadE/G-like family protein n=1 Tax=Kribbella jejuensis TaxID=236068 RepID=UPI00114D8E9B|nr:flp pilus-assembly TadE/G-like family protein [Kribbella jejuensis]
MNFRKRVRSERGSATLHVVFMSALLFAVLTASTLWTAISTGRHKVTAAADLTALSAAQSMIGTDELTDHREDRPGGDSGGEEGAGGGASERSSVPHAQIASARPCATAARLAMLNGVRLISCEVTSGAVTVEVSLELELRIARPTLTASARAGPV